MSLRWQYAQGKFSEALGSMASSSKPLKERLENAYVAFIARLQLSDFPNELHERIEKLGCDLSSGEPRYKGEGSVHATIREMHSSKAKKLISEIASIEYMLSQVYDS